MSSGCVIGYTSLDIISILKAYVVIHRKSFEYTKILSHLNPF